METNELRATRGHGLLEGFLARQRARRADSLIPEGARRGRILDIGCGSYPSFLTNTRFAERYGVDRITLPYMQDAGLNLIQHDIADGSALPFADAFFDVVTMLAVFEHIEASNLGMLLQDVRRVLNPGGLYVMTTPARWTEGILAAMSRLGLVSHEEIIEHKAQYSGHEIVELLRKSGFNYIRHGSFELGMNLWAVAQKNS